MRALRRATLRLTLLLALPASALAQAPGADRAELVGSGLASPPGWWGAMGRAGWLPDADLGVGYPWALAGLVTGAWSLEETGRTRGALPTPGVAGAQGALAWFDTLAIAAGERGGWDGFDAALARATAGPGLMWHPGAAWTPRADLVLTNGARGLGDHALGLWRGDSLAAFRADVASGERGRAGALAGAGRDLYQVAGTMTRGRHALEGGFAHRRASASLTGGETQHVRGEGGHAHYRYHDGRWRLDGTFARGYDRHESSGGALTPGLRLADANTATVDLERAGAAEVVGLRWTWSETHVAPAQGSGARERARAHWGAARWEAPFAEGRIEAALGLGRHDRVDRTVVAPSLAWRFTTAPWTGRVVLERLVTPVWTDLAGGESAFLQDTWAAGFDVGTRGVRGGRARIGFLAGRTRDRALLSRLPLESLALRSGFRRDPQVYDFGLLTGEAVWRAAHWAGGMEGFVLARDASASQSAVDPGRGARVFIDAGVSLFQGDLRIRPRLEASGIGRRESEAAVPRTLPAYVTFACGLELTLADAGLLIEGRNLENRARPQTWVDSATGFEALGPGREVRATFTWRFWD